MLSSFKESATRLLKPLTSVIAKTGVNPNVLTFAGLVVGLVASYFVAFGDRLEAASFVILSAVFDVLDGALARNEGFKTRRGGFLDSVFDRYVDSAIIIALGYRAGNVLLGSIALVGALMVSYTRARAEVEIEKCDVGIAERGERILIILLGIIFSVELYALVILAILSHATAVHRIVHAYRRIKESETTETSF